MKKYRFLNLGTYGEIRVSTDNFATYTVLAHLPGGFPVVASVANGVDILLAPAGLPVYTIPYTAIDWAGCSPVPSTTPTTRPAAMTALHVFFPDLRRRARIVGEIQYYGLTLPEDAPEMAYLLPCDGATYETAAHPALFDRIRYEHGGNGSNTFAVPDLRGRVPMGGKTDVYTVGQRLGAETVSLTAANNGQHRHAVNASGAANGNVSLPTLAYPSGTGFGDNEYSTDATTTPVTMGENMIEISGSGAPFSIIQPSAVVGFYIVRI